MRTATQDFLDLLPELVRETRGRVFTPGYTLEDGGDLVSFKIEGVMGERLFGNAPSKVATMVIQNAAEYTFSLGSEFEIFLGFTILEEVEYIKQGTFILDNYVVDEVNDLITLILFDKMVNFDAKYSNENFVFPIQINTFIEELAELAGIEVAANTAEDFILNRPPNVVSEEFTLREVLGWTCELLGANAIINDDGELVIKRYEEVAATTITADDYDELKTGQFNPDYNALYITHTPENDNLFFPDPLTDPAFVYNINNNAVSYFNREDIIEEVQELIEGHEYTDFELNWRGNYLLELGDTIEIYDVEDDRIYKTYYNNFSLEFDGGTTEKVYIETLPFESVDRRTLNMKNFRNEISFLVNKIDNRIEALVQETDGIYTLIEQNSDNITAIVSDLEGPFQELSQLRQDIDGISVQVAKIGGDNLIKNSSGHYTTDWVNKDLEIEQIKGDVNSDIMFNTRAARAIYANAALYEQDLIVPSGEYIMTWKMNRKKPMGEASISINGVVFEAPEVLDEWREYKFIFITESNSILIGMNIEEDENVYIADMMLTPGIQEQVWTPANGESILGGVRIGRSIEILSDGAGIKQQMDYDGNRIIDIQTNQVISEYTKDGLITKNMISDRAEISKLLMVDLGNQSGITRI